MPFNRACLAAALLLTGCAGSEHSDLKEFVAQSGEQMRGHVEVLQPPQVPESVVYQAQDEPDPFSPARTRPSVDRKVAATQWTPPTNHEALEAYPLESLTMVGTLQRNGTRWALIRTPDHVVHRVKKGHRLGENFGAVAEVTDTSLILSEHVEDGSGLWIERVASLSLVEATNTN